MKNKHNLLFVMAITIFGCTAQNTEKMEEKTTENPMICDMVTGMCAVANDTISSIASKQNANQKPIQIYYFTDPICSSCWGIEPQLRKLKLEYGDAIHLEYKMGGLLRDWSYNSGGISKPSDVAHHWDEVSTYYDMPIDGDLWLEDPLSSSYPPSIAFKAAQIQSPEKAELFMRKIREMVFLEKRNITDWKYIEVAAKRSGLDAEKMKISIETEAKKLFFEDLEMARKLGVRGFPTLIFVNAKNEQEIISGSKPYIAFEQIITKLQPSAQKTKYDVSTEALFEKYQTLTAREFSELSGIDRKKSEEMLLLLVQEKKLKLFKTKNGNIYIQ